MGRRRKREIKREKRSRDNAKEGVREEREGDKGPSRVREEWSIYT